MRGAVLLGSSRNWQCPDCNDEAVTAGDVPNRFHRCKGLHGLLAPMVPAGTRAKVGPSSAATTSAANWCRPTATADPWARGDHQRHGPGLHGLCAVRKSECGGSSCLVRRAAGCPYEATGTAAERTTRIAELGYVPRSKAGGSRRGTRDAPSGWSRGTPSSSDAGRQGASARGGTCDGGRRAAGAGRG